MGIKTGIGLVIVSLAIGLACGQESSGEAVSKSGGSDLASLARKEAARRESLAVKGPVITNIELTRMVGAMRSSAEASIKEVEPGEEGDSPSAGLGGVPETGLDEKEARLDEFTNTLAEARQEVETLSNSYMVLELRINSLRNRLYQEADPQRQQMLQKELDAATTDIGRIRTEESEARSNLNRLMSEARRAGMLPGEVNEIVGKIPETKSSGTID